MAIFEYTDQFGNKKTFAVDKPFNIGQLKGKRKLRIGWTCSDSIHHEHKTRIGAWLCGRWQLLTSWISKS